jgi:choice-of-anchor B domain-containing protein
MKMFGTQARGHLWSCALLAAMAGSATSVMADDDDKKLLDKKPAIRARMFSPDPWKLLQSTRPVDPGAGDASFPAKNVNLKTWIPLNSFAGFSPGDNGADCWGYTSPSGREYALMGLSWGNGIVEVTNPASPTIVTVIPGSVDSLWRDIEVIGNYAYAVSDQVGVGIQVLNLANIDSGSVTLVRNYSQGGHTTTHTLVTNPASGYLYLCGGNAAGGGIIPANTNVDPTFPTFTGPGWTTQYVHEAQIINYTSGPYAGKEIAFLFAGGPFYGYSNGLAIVDITNKASPQQLSLVPYPGFQFCHQGWVTPDRKYLYVDDELDEPGAGSVPRCLTRIFDISDLSIPRLISTCTNALPSVDHNQYVKGRYLYQSNYTTGLRVWDITNPLKPYEVAWFDSRPEDNGTGYNGAWGNYPYFNSGTILISDLERGLFITKMSILEFNNTVVYPTTLMPGAPTPITATITSYDGATIGLVNLRVSVNGAAYTSIPMTHQGSGVYTANIPAQSAFARVRYYIQADTNDVPARPFTWPLDAAGGDVFTAYAETGQTSVFSDNFQTNTGWAVTGNASGGAWTRVTPLNNGGHGAVIGDADASGMCMVTGNTLNAGVSGGSTTVTSPALSLASSPEARISYSRWFLSLVGTTDSLVTEISSNGTSWVNVETLNVPSGGWAKKTIRVADYFAPTNQVRVRFTVSNTDSSKTEAGLDAFVVVSPTFTPPPTCYADCDTVGGLTANDFSCFLNAFANGASYADCDGVGGLTPNDFSCFLNAYANGCT